MVDGVEMGLGNARHLEAFVWGVSCNKEDVSSSSVGNLQGLTRIGGGLVDDFHQ